MKEPTKVLDDLLSSEFVMNYDNVCIRLYPNNGPDMFMETEFYNALMLIGELESPHTTIRDLVAKCDAATLTKQLKREEWTFEISERTGYIHGFRLFPAKEEKDD